MVSLEHRDVDGCPAAHQPFCLHVREQAEDAHWDYLKNERRESNDE